MERSRGRTSGAPAAPAHGRRTAPAASRRRWSRRRL